MNNHDLRQHSLKVILDNQQPNGAYIACPNMPDYQYSWFRDGAYIAYALTLDGITDGLGYDGSMAAQWESAGRFHDWCAAIVLDREAALERTIERLARGETVIMADTLNARYQADGSTGPEEWPEFQLDGPGIWLWSLAFYVKTARITPLPARWVQAITLTARYLAAAWQTPCYDFWEERGTDIHISTLGAIYAGLCAADDLLGQTDFAQTAASIRNYVLTKGLTPSGELAKSVGLDMVDANLISVAVPHGLLAPNDPIMVKTIARIERQLRPANSGVHRHIEDEYYGGGVWVLLALWLGWYYTEAGESERARELFNWSATQIDSDGNLPEQVVTYTLQPERYNPWVDIRGPIAQPLLWSHAKYLIVYHLLKKT